MSKHGRRHKTVQSLLFVITLFPIISCGLPKAAPVVKEPPSKSADRILQQPMTMLRRAFRTHYDEAVANHQRQLHAAYPVITQDLLSMTLIRSTGERCRYPMNTTTYFLMAHTSHPPLTVYSLLSRDNFGSISSDTIAKLAEYRKVLQAASLSVTETNLQLAIKDRLKRILNSTEEYVDNIISKGETNLAEFENYASQLGPLIKENLYIGAREQLDQFRSQMEVWRKAFPMENWGDLRVVILGYHQPRDLYVLKLFFKWLLREPEYEERVVFAEFQDLITGDKRDEAEKLALLLLAKVDFEKGVGQSIFGDRLILQKDVMGPAAVDILKQWGSSNWPQP
jgi:hypothetical protein